MVPAAFGSQTAGSLTRPAAYCGIVGYKASHGEFSLSGLRPLAESFDSLGILTRDVADAALMRAVLLRQDAATTRASRTLRLGFCRSFDWHRMEDAAKDATSSALASLRAAGARIEDIELPPAFAPMNELHRTIMAFEVARNYTFERVFHRPNLSATFLALCETGMETDHSTYVAALNQIASCRTAFAQLFAGYDAWLAPSALGEAPLASDGTGDPVMSRMWTALQGPSVSLPIGPGPRLPIALQLVGPPRSDDQLLSVALWLEPHLARA
jgi:Asp-tRNA(Asn)/Glu-tRNA(Gln) amidotransferase A subunit family amidase